MYQYYYSYHMSHLTEQLFLVAGGWDQNVTKTFQITRWEDPCSILQIALERGAWAYTPFNANTFYEAFSVWRKMLRQSSKSLL